jgi:hypothetical protein
MRALLRREPAELRQAVDLHREAAGLAVEIRNGASS